MRSFILPVSLCLVALTAFAQSDRGTITGTVTDPAGAVVANASVQAKNTETGAIFPTTTTATGNYTLAQLPVGNYELTVEVMGFKKYVHQNLQVQVAQVIRQDVPLEVGTSTESVTVSAEASLLKTESADVSSNVTVQSLDQLPILGTGSAAAGSSGIRNPNNVTWLIPGTYYAPNANVKVNGAPTNSQAFRVEGMDATNQLINFAPAETQPSTDAIQEVSVQTSNYAPEFGSAGGGFFNVTMKSGTNQYHGSAYDYFVNEVLNAGTPFTDNGQGEHLRPPARRNDYGFTVGGPVWIPKVYNGHDKTFFFFNFEQFRETQHINNIPQTVPILPYRQGNFSAAETAVGSPVLTTDLLGRPVIANEIYDPTTTRTVQGQPVADPFDNNTIPLARMDPVALKVQQQIPNPTSSGLFNNFLPTYPSTRHTTIPAVKVDQNIGSKHKLSFYWSYTHTDSQYSPTYGQSEGFPDIITATRGTFIHSHIERLNYDYTVTPTLLLHLGAGYQQNNFFDDAPILDFNAEQTYGLKGATLNRNVPVFTGFCPAFGPGAAICGAAGGMENMGPAAGQTHSYLEKPSANASLTWVKSNHTYKFGSDLFLVGVPAIPYTNTNGNFVLSANETNQPYLVGTTFRQGTAGFPYASFLLGNVDSFTIAAPSEARQGQKHFALYAQDSWKATRKLTLTYGVRWDYGTYAREQYGRSVNFSPTVANPNAGNHLGGTIFEGDAPGRCNCDFASNYPWAFGPRVGVAYQLDDKTVLRAGWGLIYNQTTYGGLPTAASVSETSPGSGVPAMTLAGGIPITPSYPVFSPGIFPANPGQIYLNAPFGINMMDQNAGRPARQNQWSIGIQREFGRDLVADVSYVANRGAWWSAPGLANINAITPARLAAFGLNINDPATQTLLTSPLNSAAAVAAGIQPPYAGFPASATVAQALRPYPQFGTITDFNAPLGKTWYDSLQAKLTKRLSHGLTANIAFSWQKSLQEGVDSNTTLNNILANKSNAKSLSSFDQPLLLVISAEYTVPTLSGNKVLSWTLRDWYLGTLLQYGSGLPIPVPAATTSLANQLFQSTLYNRVPGQPLYTVDINCHCFDPAKTFVLNPAAWVNPPQGQFSNSAEFYNDFRYQRHPQENFNFGRNFRFTERYSLSLRIEFLNIFNRTYLNNPFVTNPQTPQTKNAQGLNSGGWGYINLATTGTQFGQPRQGTIVARFQF